MTIHYEKMPKQSSRSAANAILPKSLTVRDPSVDRPVVALGEQHVEAVRFETHAHANFAQLLCCLSGVLEVECGGERAIVPPGHALFIRPGEPHSVHVENRARLRTLDLWPSASQLKDRQRCVIPMGDLLAALVERACEMGTDDADITSHARRVLDLILDEVAAASPLSLSLPRGRDPRVLKVTELLLRSPDDGRDLDELARLAGASPRNFIRLFRRETGFTLKAYRRLARVQRAIVLMAGGQTASSAGASVGYLNQSTFTHAFREATGKTPRAKAPPEKSA